MLCKFLLSIGLCFASIAAPVIAGDLSTFEYQYQGKPGVNLAKMSRGPLQVLMLAPAEQKSIITSALLQEMSATSLTNLVHSAIIQALTAAATPLAATDAEPGMILELKLIEFGLKPGNDDPQTLQLKTAARLLRSGNAVWQSTLIGEAVATPNNNLPATLNQVLESLTDSLFADGYFLNEVEY